MNKTKKLTTGAMLLAIVGALMLIDRQLSFLFQEIIVLIAPVIIIIYSTMYDLKDGAILSVSLLILGFLLGSTYTYCYLPIGVIVGMGYSFGVKKNLDKTKLMLISMILFIFGEVLITFVIYPIMGISLTSQINELKTVYEQLMSSAGLSIEVFDEIGINLLTVIALCLVLSTLLVGIMEGFIIHLLSIFLLARFKIKVITKGNILSIELKPVVAYICFISTFSLYFVSKIDNETVKLIIITISMIGSMILIYYGYIFAIVYIKMRTRKKSAGALVAIVTILLMPFSLMVLMIVGFLYGAGPFKKYLVQGNNQQ